MGDSEAAEEDFQLAADIEGDRQQIASVNRALERVQGPLRLVIERFRADVIAAARPRVMIARQDPGATAAPAPVAPGPVNARIDSVPDDTLTEPEMDADDESDIFDEPALTDSDDDSDDTDTSPLTVEPEMDDEPDDSPIRRSPAVAGGSGGIDLAWLPPESELVVNIQVAEIWNARLLKPLLDSPEAQMGVQQMAMQLGFTAEDIDSVTIGLPDAMAAMSGIQPPGMAGGFPGAGPPAEATPKPVPPFIGVVRCSKPVDIELLKAAGEQSNPGAELEEVDHNGTTYFAIRGAGGEEPAVFQADPSTFVFGKEESIQDAIDRGPDTTGGPDLAFVDESQHFVIAFVPENLGFLLQQVPDPPPGQAPPSVVEVLETLRSTATGAALGISITNDVDLKIMLSAADDSGAVDIADAMDGALQDMLFFYEASKAGIPPQMAGIVDDIVEGIGSESIDDVYELTATIPGEIKDAITPDMMLPLMMMGAMGGGGLPMGPGAGPGAFPPGDGSPGNAPPGDRVSSSTGSFSCSR